jgi:hypothetical protein
MRHTDAKDVDVRGRRSGVKGKEARRRRCQSVAGGKPSAATGIEKEFSGVRALEGRQTMPGAHGSANGENDI